jgi:hypothetical protein
MWWYKLSGEKEIIMKKMKAAAVILALALPAGAGAMEFQTPGAVGIGGAGVARATDARAVYWNPGGLAFPEKNFSSRLNLGTGININSSLAANVDKIGKMDVNDLKNLSFTSGSLDTTANASATAQAVEYIGIVNDLAINRGTMTATPGGFLAFQYRGIGVAAIMSSEIISYPIPDTKNVRPGDPTLTTVPLFAIGIGAVGATTSGTLFDSTQRTAIEAAFLTSGATSAAEAKAIVDRLEAQLQAGNKSEQTSQQLADALILMANSFTSGLSIEKNTTAVFLSGFALAEIPVAYGHQFDLGGFGKLGLGAAVKVMQGTTSFTRKELITLKDSGDIFKDVKNNQTDSTNFGIDLGTQWRLEDVPIIGPLNVGFVVKNVNSPQFDSYKVNGVSGPKVKVEPQARLGVAIDPLSWLTIAADMDVSKNKTVLPNVESQVLGGGAEAHFSWIAVRGGVYKNMTDSAYKPVLTAGLSLGPQWLRLDVDGAMSTEKTKYQNKDYPREVKIDFGLSTMF